MPWSQLTHLQIDDGSVSNCRAILLQCINLVSAQFITFYEWDSAGDQVPVVVLPFLETLAITFYGECEDEFDGMELFFQPLALPSLQTLDLGFDPDEVVLWPTTAFSQFQTRSPNIEQISLFYSAIGPEALVVLLQHASALTTLRIEQSQQCADDDVSKALIYHPGDSSPLVPKLQELSLITVGVGFPDILFEDVIRSRWWPDDSVYPAASPPRVARLKKVVLARDMELWMDSDIDELDIRMKDLVAQGLDLDIQ
ncbi:hypothetical protein DFH09DRAFT_1188537 [Mycena vulgaris]|nr:hypothetical protein DFH09DRAFT_1188537 [Mycena vulgaris]